MHGVISISSKCVLQFFTSAVDFLMIKKNCLLFSLLPVYVIDLHFPQGNDSVLLPIPPKLLTILCPLRLTSL